MGRGYSLNSWLLILNLVLLILIIDSLTLPYFLIEAAVLLFLVIFSLMIIFIIRRRSVFWASMSFYAINLFNIVFLYFIIKSYLLILLTIVNVFGFVYSVERIGQPKRIRKVVIKDFSPKQKKRMIEKELKKSPDKKEPEIEEYDIEDEYIASATSDKFHTQDCRYAKNISYKNQVKFSSKQEAIGKGYKPGRCVE
ncbi:hypothetical protein GF327_02580 [Candidatus Woesearchaeota archaeon]|nr:hypothetical protein [Candidatus Woesearchaeota archaeon]